MSEQTFPSAGGSYRRETDGSLTRIDDVTGEPVTEDPAPAEAPSPEEKSAPPAGAKPKRT